ncbi:hypothetical protein [Peribacillus simplex]|uniref:hypothetical protein n=1 Tax=Peribacillus simplex TaxID=1478 RepID=UPI0024C0D95E|nr:hypothetical protein [Peribacillus simplex]WHY96419.1 hypothetical protein QNH37_20905 [Peribacillus simplex]
MRVLLELIRIILIFGIAGTIFSTIVNGIYINIGVNEFGWLGSIAILLLLFVWYRNKLQFSGWYSGKGKEKLPKMASQTLILCSVFLLCAPPVLSVLQMIFH